MQKFCLNNIKSFKQSEEIEMKPITVFVERIVVERAVFCVSQSCLPKHFGKTPLHLCCFLAI